MKRTEIEFSESKEKGSKTCPCGGKKEHLGYRRKTLPTAIGTNRLKRIYRCCTKYRTPSHPADEELGIESGCTVGARRMVVFAGANGSFTQASEHLVEFCGLRISRNTIRDVCQREAPGMARWQRESPGVHESFVKAKGNVEVTTDGTCVNTTEGWREMASAMRAYGASAPLQ